MRLLVIRTSAMGDVAMTNPVLRGIRNTYPEVEIVLLTRSVFKPYFTSIDGLKIFSPDLKKRHKGFTGIFTLFRDINRSGKPDYIIDLHDVLRSKLLRIFFRISGIPVSVIDKGRSEKKHLIKGRSRESLKHSVERYCDVFAKAGFPVSPADEPSIVASPESLDKARSMTDVNDGLQIGIAPYAKHKLKVWPEENMIALMKLILHKHKTKFLLFGGPEDSEKLDALQSKFEGSVKIAGLLSLDEELALMSRLDLMIAMDSSNMHMGALTGTKVISIWGGTDPLTGFGAWKQPESYSIRMPLTELTCRPCTIFGKGECKRGDFACMNWLTPEAVFEKIEKLNLL